MSSGYSRFTLVCLALLWLTPGSSLLAAEEFKVVATVRPIHSLLAGLMQGLHPPLLLIDGPDTPFDFIPDAKDQHQLAEASLVFWVGPELESSLTSSIGKLPQERVIELLSSEDMKILPSRHNPDRRDPYFWMDDRNMQILLDRLTQRLIDADPLRTHVYNRNRLEMLKPLQRIDREYEYGYRGLKAGLAVTYFDTLRYFEQAYALKTLGQVAGSPRDPIQAADLLQVRALIGSGQAECLLVDQSMPADHIELLTLGQQVRLGTLDVFGASLKPGPDLYLQLMQKNTDVIKRCLNADMQAASQARQDAASDPLVDADGSGGRFFLQDHQGNTFTERDLLGSYSLIFFGYTQCPDVCPTSLSVVSQAMRLLGDHARMIQPVFISVDPERDTVEVLAEYVKYFDPRIIGLTGTGSMVERVAQNYGVQFAKVPGDLSNPQSYAVDHSASLYFMGPNGHFITKFSYGINAESLIDKIQRIIAQN